MQKTTSNRNFAESGTSENDSELKVELCRKNPSVPSTLLPLPKASAKPDGPERDRSDREVDEDLGDDRADVLAAREADLEHGEACLHEEHHAAGDDDPDRVDGELELFWRHTRLLSSDHEKAAPKFGNGFIACERATSPALIHMVQ